MEKTKRDLEKLRVKLGRVTRLNLTPEARRLLRLFAEGLHDWQQPPYREPVKKLYMEAAKTYGPELREGLSSEKLYWFLFMISFRGGRDSQKADESLMEAYILARKAYPEAMEELFSGKREGKELLKAIDKALSEEE